MKVFLSYRRDDTGGRAGRLFDLFVARFGPRNVFQDVNAVAPGLDFTAQVEAAIAASEVVLVVIGPNWLGDASGDGNRRIDEAGDFVRQEVSQALAAGIRVVPVLVDGASLPVAEDLPDDLAPLAHRQAVTLRDVSWHTDVNDLIRRLEGEQSVTTPRNRRPIVLAAGIVGLLVVGIIVTVLIIRAGDEGTSSDQNSDGSVADTSPINLPPGLQFARTASATRVCGPGGQVVFSAGPAEQQGDLIVTDFTASAHGLQTDTLMNPVRVVDDQSRPYEGPDGGDAFVLGQDGSGPTNHVAHLSVNRDEQAHPGTTGLVLVITGACTSDKVYLPIVAPGG
ncbi:MAG TPA: toll/interleukin-1 receptor domain-containing protein [Acidimicrobiales bacterium]